eukprot:3131940-Lingulodinium_polyedra.AAC.1
MRHAAAQAFQEAFGAAQESAVMALVGWIQAHARIQYDLGGIRQWQWPLLLQCWVMEQAGIHTEFARDP